MPFFRSLPFICLSPRLERNRVFKVVWQITMVVINLPLNRTLPFHLEKWLVGDLREGIEVIPKSEKAAKIFQFRVLSSGFPGNLGPNKGEMTVFCG